MFQSDGDMNVLFTSKSHHLPSLQFRTITHFQRIACFASAFRLFIPDVFDFVCNPHQNNVTLRRHSIA